MTKLIFFRDFYLLLTGSIAGSTFPKSLAVAKRALEWAVFACSFARIAFERPGSRTLARTADGGCCFSSDQRCACCCEAANYCFSSRWIFHEIHSKEE
ncbi:MAG: hypothetical protein EBS30_06595 [Planctomycetes bacterium]|nr:hypothetical protein [Planctomycetota bacterium]